MDIKVLCDEDILPSLCDHSVARKTRPNIFNIMEMRLPVKIFLISWEKTFIHTYFD